MTPGEKVRLEKWHRPPTNEPPHKRGDVIERNGKFMEVVQCHRVPRPHIKDGQKTYTVGWRLELKFAKHPTDAERELLRHALGLDEETGAGKPYRNYYCTRRDNEVCVALEAKGWLKWTDDTWTMYRGMWAVTPAGLDALKADPAWNPAGKATTIRIADWSLYPCGRYRQHGDHSAEAFRDDHLIPALEKHEYVEVDMSGPLAFGSSWLEECFGGLVRAGYSAKELEARLTVVGGVGSDRLLARQFIEEADQCS